MCRSAACARGLPAPRTYVHMHKALTYSTSQTQDARMGLASRSMPDPAAGP